MFWYIQGSRYPTFPRLVFWCIAVFSFLLFYMYIVCLKISMAVLKKISVVDIIRFFRHPFYTTDVRFWSWGNMLCVCSRPAASFNNYFDCKYFFITYNQLFVLLDFSCNFVHSETEDCWTNSRLYGYFCWSSLISFSCNFFFKCGAFIH